MTIEIQSPFQQFFDLAGKPLDAGYIYYGVAGLNPETNPLTVYWDAEGAIPAAQPIRTLAGYPARSGAPAAIYVGSAYSITIKDKNGALVAQRDSVSPTGMSTYDTLADAVTDVTLNAGDTVGTLGYETKGDGGGWFYDVMTLAAFAATPDGMGDHLTAGGLVLKLIRGGTFVAERYGALDGEVSANLQAAWDDMCAWQIAHGVDSPVAFSYSGNGTLKNQVAMRQLDGTRIANVTLHMEASFLTAVAGGDLTSTNAMLLCRFNAGEQYFGTLDGGKFAAGYDFFGIGAARMYNMQARRCKGKHIRFRGACGAAAVYNPRAQEYLSTDPEYNTQANFTSSGISIEDGDFNIYNANVLNCNPCINISDGSGTYIIAAHLYNGSNNYDQPGGAPFEDMPVVINTSTGRNNLTNCYLDDGPVYDYEGTLRMIGCSATQNDRAVITAPFIPLYPQTAGQTAMPDVLIQALRTSGSIGFVNNGSDTWAGDVTAADEYYTGMLDGNVIISAYKTHYHLYPANDPDIAVHIKTQEDFRETYKSGADKVDLRFSPAKNQMAFSGNIKGESILVSDLTPAATAGENARSFVKDATATTFASVVTGGGSNRVPVYSDGTNWRIG